jgi:hypothetical protein
MNSRESLRRLKISWLKSPKKRQRPLMPKVSMLGKKRPLI